MVVLCYLLEQIASSIDSMLLPQLPRPSGTGVAHTGIVEQTPKGSGHIRAIEVGRHNPATHPKTSESRRVVRLIEPHRHRQLWNAGGKALGQCADSPVMHEGSASMQYRR